MQPITENSWIWYKYVSVSRKAIGDTGTGTLTAAALVGFRWAPEVAGPWLKSGADRCKLAVFRLSFGYRAG